MEYKVLEHKMIATTDAQTLYSSGKYTTVIKNIMLTNTSSSDATFTIYYAKEGQSYSASTALVGYETTIAANATELIEFVNGFPMSQKKDSIGIKISTANAVTVILSGDK